jgi:hypothetical protein
MFFKRFVAFLFPSPLTVSLMPFMRETIEQPHRAILSNKGHAKLPARREVFYNLLLSIG